MIPTSSRRKSGERELLLFDRDQDQPTASYGYQPINSNDEIQASFVGRSFDGLTKAKAPKWTQTLGHTGRICLAISILVISLIILGRVWRVNKQPLVVPVNPFDKEDIMSSSNDSSELLLVNVVFRHGDRAPINIKHLGMQPLVNLSTHIWPAGISQITDVGQLRMFKLGLALRDLYRVKLRAHSSNAMMAFSSDQKRCIDSLKVVLRAFYNFEVTIERGLEIVKDSTHCQKEKPLSDVCQVLADSGWPDEWKRVKIDSESMTALRSKFIARMCLNFNSTKCPLYASLYADKRMVSVPGFKELEKQISETTGDEYNFDLVGFFPDLLAILKVASLPVVRKFLIPHASWLTKPIAQRGNRKMTLYNTLEGLNLIGDYICFGDAEMGRLQTSQLITSLVESQSIALGEYLTVDGQPLSSYNYSDKRIIMYATHDTLIEMLLKHLGISNLSNDGDKLGENFMDFSETGSQVDELLAGFKRAEFGASVVFELRQTRPKITKSNTKSETFVRSLIYQRNDAIYDRVVFEPIRLGYFCRSFFQRSYGLAADVDQYYKFISADGLNKDFDCPFELWKNITSDQVIPQARLAQLCNG